MFTFLAVAAQMPTGHLTFVYGNARIASPFTVRRQGEVLSRTELAEQVWDMNFDTETNMVEAAIRRLRGKLDAPFECPLLHTARCMGYVLEMRDE